MIQDIRAGLTYFHSQLSREGGGGGGPANHELSNQACVNTNYFI
jgi:hypothetical protein